MTLLSRTALAIATVCLACAPAFASAAPIDPDECYFQTPVSAKGRFIFIQKISRRMLRQMVLEELQSTRVQVPLPREIL